MKQIFAGLILAVMSSSAFATGGMRCEIEGIYSIDFEISGENKTIVGPLAIEAVVSESHVTPPKASIEVAGSIFSDLHAPGQRLEILLSVDGIDSKIIADKTPSQETGEAGSTFEGVMVNTELKVLNVYCGFH